MSGVGSVANSGGSANIAAIVDAELAALAADAAALKALLSTGDVVQAQVLPSNGLTDLIAILGNRVAAALPPNLTPGDVVTVQVTGFNGDQINVQIVSDPVTPGTPLPSSTSNAPPLPAPPVTGVQLPPVSGSATAPAASSQLPPPSITAPSLTGPSLVAPAQISSSVSQGSPPIVTATPVFIAAPGAVAPPTAVFVAASVRPAQVAAPAASEPVAVEPTAPTPPPVAPGTPEVVPASTASAIVPPSARAPIPTPVVLGDIEARLATARAAVLPKNSVPPPASSTSVPESPAAAAPVINRPFVMAPLMTNARPASSPAPAVPAAPAAAAVRLATYQDPVTLLRALRLPVTPTNVAAARMAIDTPEKLPNALATLARALPTSIDPRITTLRTLTAFVGRIEPESPVLATQIAAFVDQVVTGAEPKLAQLLAALRAAVAEPLPAEMPPPAAPALGTAASQAPLPGAPANQAAAPNAPSQTNVPGASANPAPPALPVTVLARAAERQVALDFDLKTQLLSIVTSPPPGASEALNNAVAGVLTALTALQVNAASTFAANPNGFAFVLPIALPSGMAQANVQVDRDAPGNPRVPFDGDNFHIAFILETAHLGTVAIDLRTVGRTVTIDVKAEATLAARAFGKAMEQLTARLEKLRYKVAKADASVAARGMTGIVSTTIGPQAAPTSPADPTKLVDRSA